MARLARRSDGAGATALPGALRQGHATDGTGAYTRLLAIGMTAAHAIDRQIHAALHLRCGWRMRDEE